MSPADPSDAELLDRYLTRRDEAAARAIVERYQHLVYAAALRQVRKRALAEDVTGAVFLVLVQKAASLRGRATIGGWLLTVTRYAAIDALRNQDRRARHERAAARPDRAPATPAPDEDWQLLSSVLDDAMARLSERDRAALVLRYYQNLPLAGVATALGVSAEAARKRVDRGLAKLETAVRAGGVAMLAAAIAPLLEQHATAATLPAEFAVTLTGTMAGATGSAAAHTAALAKGTSHMIAFAKAKFVAAITAAALAVLLIAVGGTLIARRISAGQNRPPVAEESARDVGPVAPMPVADVPLTGAALLYRRAAESIKVDSPTSSVLDYAGHPPYPPEWHAIAEAADTHNKPARDLVRQARQFDAAEWPAAAGGDLKYLNGLRALANEVGDAALLAHVRGRDAEAVELLRDLLHLTRLLADKPNADGLVRTLVAIGIDALTANRLMIIAADIKLAPDAGGGTLGVADTKTLIEQLLATRSPQEQYAAAFAAEPALSIQPQERALQKEILGPSRERFFVSVQRVNAERTFAAMSLACHLYRFDKGTWPATLADLTPAYLPHVPIDPNGDGKQTFGYALVKNGLPDGGDRPLVYGRPETKTGNLFFRTDAPQYGFYTPFRVGASPADSIDGGQFRDVARWSPAAPPAERNPTTRPLDAP